MGLGNESSAVQLGEAGVRAVQVREHQKFNEVTSCFFLLRNDGSVDDVSARKCVARVFPSWGAAHSGKFSGPRVCTPFSLPVVLVWDSGDFQSVWWLACISVVTGALVMEPVPHLTCQSHLLHAER